MKKGTKLTVSIIGIAVVAVIAILWSLPNDKVAYNNVESARPFRGNADARIVIQEYSDFQCPACQSGAKYMDSVLAKFSDQIRFEFKHFPLTTIHENAFNSALASECANDQGKFWELHDIMFDNQNNLKKDDLKNYASQIAGIDAASFSACLDNRAEKDIVNADIKNGNNLGVQGTPTFYINGKELENYTLLEQEIQREIL
ncbi:MAG: DsbA family protein [Patescibacteria group bacterium]|jgi:protein-disulfide isomerase